MKSTIKLGILVGALCGLNNLNADVPHVFEDGEVIRAEEMNENFASINSEITTIKTDVENNSNNNSSWSEDYTYSVKDLTPGRDRVNVLEEIYDIMQFDTVSFNNHSLYTIKLPIVIDDCYQWDDDYYPLCDSLDSHERVSVRTSERRNYQDNHDGFSNTISGYPANISVNVTNSHVTDTFFDSNMTRAEFDSATYTEYYFHSSYIRLEYVDANPARENDIETYFCYTDWSDISIEKYWTWDVTTGTSDEDSITSIDDFNSILNACKAAESEKYVINQRVNKYYAFTEISISAQIELDPHTILRVSYDFDEAKFSSALSYDCASYALTDLQKQNCDATVAPFERNFSDDFAEEVKLPAKLTREQYVDQLLTVLDHIVISGSDSES
ncbi:MAG: hypothetical protein EVB03_09490 [SAR92 clade bacterium]|uniref:Uncharacterized protein n=1 Tax=SAR92 clade bacterium TaxID=2315479 RepID=A0A520MC23_9GAMM|nr:MAG: hypothetical protein EVB03_09490 [SAR92 clade bacterium]